MDATQTKIIFISLTNQPCGAENVLLIAATAVKGEMIFIKKYHQLGLQIPDFIGSKYLSHTSMLKGFIILIPLLRNFRKEDVIMSTHPYLNAFLGFLKRVGYIKATLIVRECTSVFTRFTGIKKATYRLIYRLGYPGVDLIICQTELMKSQLLAYNAFIFTKKIIVLSNPVDFNKINLKSDEQLKESEEKLEFICSAGRLIPEKGFPILINAFQIIKKKHPRLKLLLLGEGKERKLLTTIIQDNNLSDSVMLMGQIENPAPYFKKAKVCVVSSIKEGFPNVLLEMMSVNKMVITTLCAGGIDEIPHIAKVEVSDVNALAEAIQAALQHPQIADNEAVNRYLYNRRPEIFAQSIMQALHDLN